MVLIGLLLVLVGLLLVLVGLLLKNIELLLETVKLLLKSIELLLKSADTDYCGYIRNQCYLGLDALEMILNIVLDALDALKVVQNSSDVRLCHANFSNRQPVSD